MDSLLHTIIPTNFLALALAHFLALLSPGPDFFLIAGHALRYRLRGALFICLGISLGNALYIITAIAGWSFIKDYPRIYTILEISGALYLVWMGYMLLQSSRKPFVFGAEAKPALRPMAQLSAGLGSALLNPKNAIFYLSLMTVILGPNVTLSQQSFAGLWMAVLVFVWDCAVAAALGSTRVQQRLYAAIPTIEALAGIVLIGMALGIVLWQP